MSNQKKKEGKKRRGLGHGGKSFSEIKRQRDKETQERERMLLCSVQLLDKSVERYAILYWLTTDHAFPRML